MATRTHQPGPMVASGEALRLKSYLEQQRIRVPRNLLRIAHTLSNADDEQVSDGMLVDALEAAMRTLCRPSLPIDFGATVRTGDMGIYGMSLQTASTIGEALTRSVRFQRLMTTAAHVLLDRGPGALSWTWNCAESRTLGVRVRNEIVLTEHVAVVRALSPGATPRRVSFMHAAPSDITAHKRYFRCAIVWSAEADSVEWPAKTMAQTMTVDPALSAFIEREAERRLLLLPPTGSLDEVKGLILRRLPGGDADLSTVAAQLGRSPRTLRRELSRGGCTFRDIVDDIRRQRALEMAVEGRASMSEIALRLGFSEVSAFSRAWRRWFAKPFSATRHEPGSSPSAQPPSPLAHAGCHEP